MSIPHFGRRLKKRENMRYPPQTPQDRGGHSTFGLAVRRHLHPTVAHHVLERWCRHVLAWRSCGSTCSNEASLSKAHWYVLHPIAHGRLQPSPPRVHGGDLSLPTAQPLLRSLRSAHVRRQGSMPSSSVAINVFAHRLVLQVGSALNAAVLLPLRVLVGRGDVLKPQRPAGLAWGRGRRGRDRRVSRSWSSPFVVTRWLRFSLAEPQT